MAIMQRMVIGEMKAVEATIEVVGIEEQVSGSEAMEDGTAKFWVGITEAEEIALLTEVQRARREGALIMVTGWE